MGQRRDHHGRPTSGGLFEGTQFLKTDRTFLHIHPEIGGDLLEGQVGDGRQDAVGKRCYVLVALDGEEIGRSV